MKKEINIKIFEDTLKIINSNKLLNDATNNSIKNTIIYEKKIDISKEKNNKIATIKVLNERTINVINKFTSNKKTAILNFASATNPGGGVKRGSNAQEESICRCTNLYSVLSTKVLFDKYYKINREKHNSLYSDVVIYTPNIKVIKSDENICTLLDAKNWYEVDVITCAAPNLINKSINQTELLNIHKERARCILTSAIINDVKNIVLGAFGCGAFKNNPEIVAQAYKEILIDEEYGKFFDEVIFAIISNSKNDINFKVFNKYFK